MLFYYFYYRHEWKDFSEGPSQRKIKTADNPIFRNNLNINIAEHQISQEDVPIQLNIPCGPIDCIIFLGVHVYNLSNAVVRLVLAIKSLCGNLLDSIIQRYICLCVIRSLTPSKISNLIESLESMKNYF